MMNGGEMGQRGQHRAKPSKWFCARPLSDTLHLGRVDELTHKASFNALGDDVIHPNFVYVVLVRNNMLNQIERRNFLTRQSHVQYQDVFDESAEIDWTPIYSLTTGEFKYLPTAYCYYGGPQQHNMTPANSNGKRSW